MKNKHWPAVSFALLLVLAALVATALIESNPDPRVFQASTLRIVRNAKIPVRITNDKNNKNLTALYKAREYWQSRAKRLHVQNDANVTAEPEKTKPEQPAVSCFYEQPAEIKYEGESVTNHYEAIAPQGGTFTVNVYIKNIGTVPWFGDSSGCNNQPYVRLGTARDRDRDSIFFANILGFLKVDHSWIQSNRIKMLEQRVDPGQIATFLFTSIGPIADDVFREYFQPVVEGVKWMERPEETLTIDIYAGYDDGKNRERLKYLNKTSRASIVNLDAEKLVDVDISDQKMQLKMGDVVLREYEVSTGTFRTPTPLGTFEILIKQELRIGNKRPYFHMPKWQGFTQRGHGLHALPYLANDRGVFWKEALHDIGQRVSHGCIRLLPEEAAELYELTEVGTKLIVHN